MKKTFFIITLSLLLVSCNKPKGELIGTGVKGGIFRESNPYGMVYIPSGSFTMGINDESMFGVPNERPIKVNLDAFWMDATEITNDEYKQFLNYVRDSIAYRKLIIAGLDKYRKPIRGDEDEPTPEKALINWKQKLPWNSKDEEIQDILKDLYFQDRNVLNGKKEINPSKMLYYYEWYDYSQAELPQNQFDIKTGAFPKNAIVTKDSAYIDEEGEVHNVIITRKLTSRSDFYCSKIINVYPDTTAWMSDFQHTYNDPKMKMYFSHPGFSQYPVVGITWEQADAFCKWRTKLYYGTSFVAGKEFRLPSEAEWEYAARGGKELALYPWGGNYIRDSKGCFLANFKPSPAGYGDDTGKTTMKVRSFPPNNYGLYDMAGNVAEWTATAYRSGKNQIVSELNPKFQYNAKNDAPKELKRKVVKGGSWKDIGYFLQCGVKTYQYQNESRPYVGFRCVRTYVGD
ncbi:MAG: gliding motility-associated lipoprotein [Paludibacter sp.]|nr:MAG: gliding motility-associated lipoprotein [Paludibacter sp.]